MTANEENYLIRRITTEAFGPCLVIEPNRDGIIEALASSTESVSLLVNHEGPEMQAEFSELNSPCDLISRAELASLEPISSLLIFGVPEGESAEELIDLAIAKVCDDGFVLIDLDIKSKGQQIRLTRLIEASLTNMEQSDGWAREGNFALTGYKTATGQEAASRPQDDPADLTVIAYISVVDAASELLVADLLFRQSLLPGLVLLIDDTPEDATSMPEDLWGMAPYTATQPALIKTGGIGRYLAITQAMEHVTSEYLAFVEPGQRPSPQWSRQLLLALDKNPECGAVVGGAIETIEELDEVVAHDLGYADAPTSNPLALLLSGVFPPVAAAIYRSFDLKNAWGNLDPQLHSVALYEDLLLQILEKGDLSTVSLPLLNYSSYESDVEDKKTVLSRHVARCGLDRLVDSLKIFGADDHRGLAFHVRAAAFRELGMLKEALADYQSALALDAELEELQIDYLGCLQEMAKYDLLIETAGEYWQASKENFKAGVILASAFLEKRQLDHARECITELLDNYPDVELLPILKFRLNLICDGHDERDKEFQELLLSLASHFDDNEHLELFTNL